MVSGIQKADNASITNEKESDIAALIVGVAFVLCITIPISLSVLWRQNIANECDGQTQSQRVREVQGPLKKFQVSYFIPGDKGNWIVFACGGKGGCANPLKAKYDAYLGKEVRAGFCHNELLWVEIENERIFTRDTSPQSSWLPLIYLLPPLLIGFLAVFLKPKR